MVVIERIFGGQRAIQSRFQERRPSVFQHQLAPAQVVFANSGHPRVDGLAAIAVLDGRLAEKEVNEMIGFDGADEFGHVQPLGVVLHRPQTALVVRRMRRASVISANGGQRQPIDRVILAGEIRR